MKDQWVRVHVWVRGRVQGVGFRAYVAACAAQWDINGWVRNVSLDTVETLAEGSREQVDQYVQAVLSGPRSSRVDVNACQVEEELYTGEFVDFQIRSSR